jgi:hypothetical protein
MHRILALLIAVTVVAPALADEANAPAASRLRGTIEQASGDAIGILTRDGRHESVAVTRNTKINALRLLAIGDVKAGDYVGIAAMKGSGGQLRALDVVVFPEALRGVGEGQRAWDLGPDSSMTNATVAEVAASPKGQTLQLKYKGGQAAIEVPSDAPIVTPIPGDRTLLVVGKAVVAFVRKGADGNWTAEYLTVEKDGVKPPI